MIFGSLFVGALNAVAPILVFFLVMSAISSHEKGQQTNMKSILVLYLLGTFLAGLTVVVVSFIFPTTLTLVEGAKDVIPPEGIVEVLKSLLKNMADNPVSACGASGVAGGSLLLIHLAYSLFGISNDIAMQVAGLGVIVGVIQDSCETALNSSTDVLFTAVAEYAKNRKEKKGV